MKQKFSIWLIVCFSRLWLLRYPLQMFQWTPKISNPWTLLYKISLIRILCDGFSWEEREESEKPPAGLHLIQNNLNKEKQRGCLLLDANKHIYVYLHQAEDNFFVSLYNSTTLLLSAKQNPFNLNYLLIT